MSDNAGAKRLADGRVRLDYPADQYDRYEDALLALRDAALEHDAMTGSYGMAGHITTTQAGHDELCRVSGTLPLTALGVTACPICRPRDVEAGVVAERCVLHGGDPAAGVQPTNHSIGGFTVAGDAT